MQKLQSCDMLNEYFALDLQFMFSTTHKSLFLSWFYYSKVFKSNEIFISLRITFYYVCRYMTLVTLDKNFSQKSSDVLT